MRCIIVLFIVRLVALVVLPGVLGHTGEDDEGQWEGSGRPSLRNGDGLDALHGADEQEIDVGDFGELDEEVQG